MAIVENIPYFQTNPHIFPDREFDSTRSLVLFNLWRSVEAFPQLLMPTTSNNPQDPCEEGLLCHALEVFHFRWGDCGCWRNGDVKYSGTGFSYSEVKPTGQAGSFACISVSQKISKDVNHVLGCLGDVLPCHCARRRDNNTGGRYGWSQWCPCDGGMAATSHLFKCPGDTGGHRGTQGDAGGWGGQVNYQRPKDLKWPRSKLKGPEDIWRYPLVMTNIAIENGHRNSGFSH